MTSTDWAHQHFSFLGHPNSAYFITSGRVIKPNICRCGPIGLWAGYAPAYVNVFISLFFSICITCKWRWVKKILFLFLCISSFSKPLLLQILLLLSLFTLRVFLLCGRSYEVGIITRAFFLNHLQTLGPKVLVQIKQPHFQGPFYPGNEVGRSVNLSTWDLSVFIRTSNYSFE